MVLMEPSVLIAFTQQDTQRNWLVLHMPQLDGTIQLRNLTLLPMKLQILEHKHNMHLLNQIINTVCHNFSMPNLMSPRIISYTYNCMNNTWHLKQNREH